MRNHEKHEYGERTRRIIKLLAADLDARTIAREVDCQESYVYRVARESAAEIAAVRRVARERTETAEMLEVFDELVAKGYGKTPLDKVPKDALKEKA
jgi:hypothetical protein